MEISPMEISPMEMAPMEMAPMEISPMEISPMEMAARAATAPEPCWRPPTFRLVLTATWTARAATAAASGR